jgi:hypothetical protein
MPAKNVIAQPFLVPGQSEMTTLRKRWAALVGGRQCPLSVLMI